MTKEPAALRVLLVEDYPDLAEVTEALLAEEGFAVRTASSGKEALAIAPAFRPQLLLCDLYLPDTTGLEVIRSLRSDSSTDGIHAVIVSAMQDVGLRHDDGVDGFISKPITIEAVRKLKAEVTAACSRTQ